MKTIDLLDVPKIDGVPLEHIPVRACDVGMPVGRLTGLVLRGDLEDPIGFLIGKTAVVYNDWRLRQLQERSGVPVMPDPSSLTIVRIERP